MSYSTTLEPPTQNTEGGSAPPKGTTGKFLWDNPRRWRSNQINDEPVYPGQPFCIKETLIISYEIYNPAFVSSRERYFVDQYFLGTWQTLGPGADNKVLETGNSRYLVTTLERDNWFVAGYKLEDGFTDFGRLKINQCNFSLEPSTPISIEILGVEVEFASYEIPSGRGNIFSGSFSNDRAYLRNDREFSLQLGKVGFYTYQGAALTDLSYFVRQVNNCPGEAYPFNEAFCPKR